MNINKLLVATLLLVPGAAFAQNCTTISTLPATISAPGKYCLADDHTVNLTSGNAITIASNGVTLDCDGNTINNTATSDNGSSTGIYAFGRNNITVKNCRVTGGFTNGIGIVQDNAQPNRAYYNTIKDNYVAGPYRHGILGYGSVIEISGNRVYDIGGQLNSYAVGIRVAGSTVTGAFRLHVVRNNYVAGTNSPYSSAFGIFSDGSLASAFLDNGIVGTTAPSGRTSYGMYILGTHNRMSDNHVVGSGRASDVGILGDATASCFDNYIRATTATQTCDSGLGNY